MNAHVVKVCVLVLHAAMVLAQPYSNVITDIKEIAGPSTYSLVITFQNDSPIITYAPNSYEESLDAEIYRAFMPNTTLADGVDDIPGILEQTGRGIQIVLLGHLKEKIIHGNMIVVMVEIGG